MTSLSQYCDHGPRHYHASPPSESYGEDEYIPYRVEPYDGLADTEEHSGSFHDHFDSPCPSNHERRSPPPSISDATPRGIRQTPSPLRWAMQDLMDSLDTLGPRGLRALSPTPDSRDNEPLQRRHSFQEWDGHELVRPRSPLVNEAEDVAPYFYAPDTRPPGLLNYVDSLQPRLERFEQYYDLNERDEMSMPSTEDPRAAYQESSRSGGRPNSSYSLRKPLPVSSTLSPPLPPPHVSRKEVTESVTSNSTRQSIFSGASDHSTAQSSVSNESAGSARSFARKKALQDRNTRRIPDNPAAVNRVPKESVSVGLLKRRKSYGSSLKKTIGKLLNASPTKPPPGSVTDHGGKIIEWQNVRRDVNRANSPSAEERAEYREQLQMSEGIEVIHPIEILECIVEGDESGSGSPILLDEAFDITSNSAQTS
jgi:hypothetical protein